MFSQEPLQEPETKKQIQSQRSFDTSQHSTSNSSISIKDVSKNFQQNQQNHRQFVAYANLPENQETEANISNQQSAEEEETYLSLKNQHLTKTILKLENDNDSNSKKSNQQFNNNSLNTSNESSKCQKLFLENFHDEQIQEKIKNSSSQFQNQIQISKNQTQQNKQQNKSLSLSSYSENQKMDIFETLSLIQNDNQLQKKQVLFKKKKYDTQKDIQTHKECLQVDEKMFGQQHQQYIKTLNLLGESYFYKGDYQQSINCFQKIIKIYRQKKKQKDQLYFRTTNDIAAIHFINYNFDQSLNCYLTNLNQWNFQQNHYLFSTFLNNISSVYMKKKNMHLAQQYLLKSLTIQENIKDAKPQNFVQGSTNLIHIYCQIYQLKKAQNILQKCAKYLQLIQQENHPTLAKYYLKKARLRCQQQRLIQAVQIMEKGEKILKQLYKNQHINKIQGFFQIGYIYLKLNKKNQAQNYFYQCLELSKKMTGQDHPAYKYMLNEIIQIKKKFDQRYI